MRRRRRKSTCSSSSCSSSRNVKHTYKIMLVPFHCELGFRFVGPAKDCFIIVLQVAAQFHVHQLYLLFISVKSSGYKILFLIHRKCTMDQFSCNFGTQLSESLWHNVM